MRRCCGTVALRRGFCSGRAGTSVPPAFGVCFCAGAGFAADVVFSADAGPTCSMRALPGGPGNPAGSLWVVASSKRSVRSAWDRPLAIRPHRSLVCSSLWSLRPTFFGAGALALLRARRFGAFLFGRQVASGYLFFSLPRASLVPFPRRASPWTAFDRRSNRGRRRAAFFARSFSLCLVSCRSV